MRPEPIPQARFQKAFASAKAKTEKAVRGCTRRATPEAIHEARTAIRKLTTAVSLMPKGFRRDRRTVKTMKALRLFYDDCAKIRDIDAMTSALSTSSAFGDMGDVIAGLKKRRLVISARVLSSGDKASRLALPRPVDGTRRRLGRRLDRLLDKRTERVREIYRIAAEGEDKVAELHELRKQCRHVMYLLDFVNGNARVESVKKDLEDAREKLGSIRDDDVLLDVLRRIRRSPPATETAAAVAADRLIKYREFFSGQKSRNSRPKLLESISTLT